MGRGIHGKGSRRLIGRDLACNARNRCNTESPVSLDRFAFKMIHSIAQYGLSATRASSCLKNIAMEHTRVANCMFALLLYGLVASCALPLPGGEWKEIMLGSASWIPKDGRMSRNIVGIDVRAGSELPGLTIGYSEMELMRPVPAGGGIAPVEPAGLSYQFPFGLGWTTKEGVERHIGWFVFEPELPDRNDAWFACYTYLGTGFGVGDRGGVFIGAGRATALSVAPEAAGIYSLIFDSRDSSENRLEVYGEQETQ